MTLEFGDLAAGMRLSGVVADGVVTVVAVDIHGPGSATATYRSADGRLGERIIFADDLAGLAEASERRWSFDADGAMFRLASEARRMQQAHLADPFAAVDTSNIEPYPHQIDAVYNRLLTQEPLRFLLADDPGAGKTIMSGLLIRELVLRGDVARCLIVAPGSLVEQWQDERALGRVPTRHRRPGTARCDPRGGTPSFRPSSMRVCRSALRGRCEQNWQIARAASAPTPWRLPSSLPAGRDLRPRFLLLAASSLQRWAGAS